MRLGQIRESCGGCNNVGCRSFSFCGRPKAEFALRHFGKKGNAPSVLRLVSLPAVAFSMQIASLSGKIRNARCAHSNSLQRLRLQGREIRRNFSKTDTGLPLPVTIRNVNGQMVGFQTVTFQKPTISLKNIRLTCGDAGI